MINPVVSIIIPFYNPDNCFADLLDSVAAQSYENIEIVLVDDGSDKIHNILAKEFVELSDNRLLIIKENGGVASARQAGLLACTGNVIIHADADDILPEHAIERLVNKMTATGADIVIGGYLVKYKKNEKYVGVKSDDSYWQFVEGVVSGKYHSGLWNKLIKKELYRNIGFEIGLDYMEDKLILAKILKYGPYNISFLNEPVYIYQQHVGSLTNNLSLKSIESSVIVVSKVADLYQGFLSDRIISDFVKRQRVFYLIQSSKIGINKFSDKDLVLLKDNSLSFNTRFRLFLIGRKLNLLTSFINILNSLRMKY